MVILFFGFTEDITPFIMVISMVEFCPKCGLPMREIKEKGKRYLICPLCGLKKEISDNIEDRLVIKAIEIDDRVIDEEAMFKNAPTIKVTCPRCNNEEAWYVTMQTRAADEPPTRIFRCTKCGYTWREYA